MDFWQKARGFAEEAAKRSQELTRGATKISDIVSSTAKKSKEIAAEVKIEALKRADQIKTLAEGISPQIPAVALSLVDSSPATPSSSDLEKFGVTDELREFVKGITLNTFKDFPMEDEPQMSDVPTVSNVRQDLTEWQERHATIVLLTVKEISNLRYELCPRVMRERKFWRIYFILVNSHVAPYEKQYTEEIKLKSGEQVKDEKVIKNQTSGAASRSEVTETNKQSKASVSSAAEQDLDSFLLGDFVDGDVDPDDGDEAFDDDFDKIVDISEDEDEKPSRRTTTAAT